ncbi:DUF4912 domain-containing protein [Planctomicrobium sp. SH661]|uniref:DUF4912 domain-containing protein n=1 Tax=Planctomicrobium sp. SH661 TaxID=3448124 RepID=UPI003F5BEB2B
MAKDLPRTQRSYPRVSTSPPDIAGDRGRNHASSESRMDSTQRTPTLASPYTSGFFMDQNRQDALIVEEVGDCWLRARWTISQKTLERATSAMGREGHRAVRVLRLLRVEQDDSGPRSKALIQEIEVPLSAEEWFLRVPTVEHAWVVEVGVTFSKGRFFSMLHSVPVALNGSRASVQGAQRYLGSERFLDSLEGGDPPPLAVQGTFLMQGATQPGARVSVDDQSVPVDPRTGAFEWKLPLSNGRVVVPMNVIESGRIQRALLAIDLNFHLLEPEPGGDD